MSAFRTEASIPTSEYQAADSNFVGLNDTPVSLTSHLFEQLEVDGINYCHWKSNVRLNGTLEGREDIDVLIDRRDSERFQSIVSALGFKLARSRLGNDHPGVFHALGFDESIGELVDLHAYHRVLSGDSFVKNYLFPISDKVLAGEDRHLNVRVPPAEVEYLMFILRTVLKSLAPVEILKSNLHYDEVLQEIAWLHDRVDRAKAAELCQEIFPSIGRTLFEEAEAAVASKGRLLSRVRIGMKLSWRLRHFRRLGRLQAFLVHLARIATYAVVRFQKRRDCVPRSGGAIVALVGPKALGKSTISKGLAKTLSKHLDVVQIHAGKPPATLLSLVPRFFVPLARRLFPKERLREYESPERRREKQYSMFYVLRMALLGYDRRRLLLKAHRQSTAGTIVISDRYPSRQTGAIDSSCFDDEAIERAGSRLKKWVMQLERRFYDGLPEPDIVLRVHAPIELALQRDSSRNKAGGPDAEAIRRRWWIESDINFPSSRVEPIDTQQPVNDSILAAARAVWRIL